MGYAPLHRGDFSKVPSVDVLPLRAICGSIVGALWTSLRHTRTHCTGCAIARMDSPAVFLPVVPSCTHALCAWNLFELVPQLHNKSPQTQQCWRM